MTNRANHRPSWPSSLLDGESSRELRSSVRNLLLDVSGGPGSQRNINHTNVQRRSSLKGMDVPDSKVPNHKKPSSQRSLDRGASVVFNRKETSEGDEEMEKFFTVAIAKDDVNHSWGFSMNVIGGHLVITRIGEESPVDTQTDIEVGDLIWAINDKDCKNLSLREAANLIRHETSITVRAKKPTLAQRSYVEAKITKGDQDCLGFTVGRKNKLDKKTLIVKKTDKGGLAVQQTALRPGYEILAIDHVDCTHGMSIAEAAKLFLREGDADHVVNIRAKKPTYDSGRVLTVVITKETADEPVGFNLAEGDTFEMPKITNIQHDSPAYHTKLEPGFVIEAITFWKDGSIIDLLFPGDGSTGTVSQFTPIMGKITRELCVSEVAEMLASAPVGKITVRARVP